jgi:DNA helicase-4
MRNPKQLKKSIVSANTTDAGSPVNIHRFRESDPDRSRRAILIRILTSIAENRPASNVLMLGRYNKTVPDNWSELVSMAQSLGLQIKYQTCHSAKGLEADEVIVMDVNGGAMGFPCHLADDEFLQLLPSPSEAFLDAEERRLFYVALTRSKSVVHLLVDEGKPSVFLDDFEPKTETKPKSKKDRQPAERLEIPVDRLGRIPHCPSCNQPTFIKRVGAKGPFWGCSDFPKCWGRPKKCRSCGELALVLDSPEGNRYCAECGASG